jgi:hypothetical protein
VNWIIGDIHGNMTALEAVLAYLRTRTVDATCCLGDLVGYAASTVHRAMALSIGTFTRNVSPGRPAATPAPTTISQKPARHRR